MNATPTERPEAEEVTHDSGQVLHAVERVLAMCLPEHPNDYWPTKPDEYRGTGSEGALDGSTFSLFEYRNISRRLSRHAGTDAERLAIDPAYRQHAILDAMAELLKFCSTHLREVRIPNPELENYYLLDDIRRVCREHLTRLLASWYELHAFSAGEEL